MKIPTMPPLKLETVQKIAVIRRNGLGDLINALPTLLYLKKEAPQAQITLFLDAKNALLVPYMPSFGKVVVLPKKGNKYVNLLRVALRYRFEHFDVALCAKTSPMKLMNLFLFALGAKRRIASTDASFSSKLINDKRPYAQKHADTTHQALKGLQMVAPHLNHLPKDLYPYLQVPNQPPQKKELPRLLLTATTTKASSRLTPQKYGSIVNAFCKTYPCHVLILGEEKDKKRAHSIQREIVNECEVYFPRSFEAFMVCQSQCDLFFVGDGGVGHIMAALNKPGVALFGGISTKQWAPLSDKVHTLYHKSNVNALDDKEIVEQLQKVRLFKGEEEPWSPMCKRSTAKT